MISMDMDDVMDNLYIKVLSNWHNIQKQVDVMNVLNMETNGLCIKMRKEQPDVSNKNIQAKVFTILFMMSLITTIPIQQNIFDNNYIDEHK